MALELGKATSTLVGWKSCGNVHVTLGYLPRMQEDEREELEKLLNQLVKDWAYWDAEFRPANLIAFRQFRVSSREEVGYDSWKREPIVFYRKDYVQRLALERRLQSHAYTSENITRLSDRIWDRDSKRLHSAQQRAKVLPQKHSGVLTMHSPCSGLGAARECTKSAELLDLLEYLALRIDAFKGAYEKLDGKLLLPFLTDPKHWHCSAPRNLWFVRLSTTTAPPPG